MPKIIIPIIFFLFGFQSHLVLGQPSEQDVKYIEAVNDFKAGLRYQLRTVFLGELAQASEVDSAIYLHLKFETKRFARVMERGLQVLAADYQAQFIEQNASPESKARFRHFETNLKWASEIALNSIAQILYNLKVEKYRDLSGRVSKFAARLSALSGSLEGGEAIKPTAQDEFYQRFPIQEGRLKALCSVVAGICLNKKIQDLLKGLPFDGLLKEGTQIDWSEVKPLQIPASSAVVLVFNHDNTIADQKLMQLIAERMNIRSNLLTTTLKAWPHTNWLPFRNYFFKRESEATFIEDPEMNKKVMDHLKQDRDGVVSVSYFPEGDQAFWSSNFPLAAKTGGFVAARKAAVELEKQGRPVYLVQVQMNFWRQLTTQENILKISVSPPEQVPATALSKSDAWVQRRRGEFESAINQWRGHYQIDLKDPRREQGVWQSSRTLPLPLECHQLLAN